SMVIIGGGVIGMELAYIYKSFGTEVTVIEMLPDVLPREDADIVAELKRAFKKLGIQILTNTKVNRIEKDDNNLVVNYQSEEKQGEIHCEKALVSIGRKMVLPELGSVELATDGA